MKKLVHIGRGDQRHFVTADSALEDDQWQKLQDFLGDKLSPEDMETVESICREGGDAPEGKPVSGAADAARRGSWQRSDVPRPVAYDAKTFPHGGRLK